MEGYQGLVTNFLHSGSLLCALVPIISIQLSRLTARGLPRLVLIAGVAFIKTRPTLLLEALALLVFRIPFLLQRAPNWQSSAELAGICPGLTHATRRCDPCGGSWQLGSQIEPDAPMKLRSP